MKRFSEFVDEDVAANAAGLGGVAGLGVTPAGKPANWGEPGVDLKKRQEDEETDRLDETVWRNVDDPNVRWKVKTYTDADGNVWTLEPYESTTTGKIAWMIKKNDEVLDGGTSLEDATIRAQRLMNEAADPVDHFAGAPVFDLDMNRMMNIKGPKHPRHRYARYVGSDEMGEAIRQHGRRHSGDIIVREKSTAVMTYLRRKKPVGE